MRIAAKITHIDYENTVSNLIPIIKSSVFREYLPEFAVKLIAALNVSAACAVIVGVISNLDTTERYEVICGFMNEYSVLITEKVNRELKKRMPQIKIGSIKAGCAQDGMYIYANNVDVALEALMDNPAVAEIVNRKAKDILTSKLGGLAGSVFGKGAAGLLRGLVSINPDAAKTVAAQVLNSGKYTAEITGAVEEAISDWAVVRLGELNICGDTADETLALPLMPDLKSESWTDKLIAAIAAYIENINGRHPHSLTYEE